MGRRPLSIFGAVALAFFALSEIGQSERALQFDELVPVVPLVRGDDTTRTASTDISVLMPENAGTKEFAHQKDTKAPEGATTGAGIPLAANFPAAATSGLSFLIQPGGDVILDEIIGAAEARGTAKLISRPRVMSMTRSMRSLRLALNSLEPMKLAAADARSEPWSRVLTQ